MAEVKETKVIGFDIPLKSRTASEEAGIQRVNFSHENKFLIGAKEDGSSLASVEFFDNKPYLIVDSNQLNLNLTHGWIVLEDGRQAYLLSGLEIDGDNNIKITVNCQKTNYLSSIQFLPNEVVVKKQDNTVEKHQVPTLDLDLPQNLFELTQEENAFVTVKNLPAQFMSVMKNLKNVETLTLNHKNKRLTIARVGDKENPIIYVINGTKMTQHKLENFYVYTPQSKTEKGFLGIKTSKSSTGAYGLNNVEKSNMDKILKFISNDKSSEKITNLTKEQLREQVLKPRALSPGKKRSKFDTSFAKSTEQIDEEKIEQKINKKTDEDDTISTETGDNAVGVSNSGDSPVGISASTETNDLKENKNKTTEETTEKTTEETTEAKVVKAKPEDDKNSGTDKAKEEKEKEKEVDLSDLAKVFGIGLFMFGLFTGFGGILVSILAVGIGSSTIAFNKKFKNITLPKGPEALKKEIAIAKKDGKVKDVDISKKSTAKEEKEAVDHLKDKGVISKEVADEAKNIIESFEKNLGLMNKVDEFFTNQTIRLSHIFDSLKAEYFIARNNSDFKKEESLLNRKNKLEEGLAVLEKTKDDFNNFKNRCANDLKLHFKTIEDYAELKNRTQFLEQINIEPKKEDLKQQLKALVAERNNLDGKTKSEEDTRRLTVIETTIGKLDRELTLLYNQSYELHDNNEKIEQFKQSVVNPKVINQLKSMMIDKTKTMFKKFYDQAKDLEDTYKKFTKIKKEDHKLAEEVQNFS